MAEAAGIERVIYVLDGEVALHGVKNGDANLAPGGFAFLPADSGLHLRAKSAARLNVFEKCYVPLASVAAPGPRFGQEQAVEGVPFLGDADAMLKTFLPTEPAFDLAVSFQAAP